MTERLTQFVGLHEVGQLLGVSRARADQLSRTKGFPDPEFEIKAGRIWKRAAVENWIKKERG